MPSRSGPTCHKRLHPTIPSIPTRTNTPTTPKSKLPAPHLLLAPWLLRVQQPHTAPASRRHRRSSSAFVVATPSDAKVIPCPVVSLLLYRESRCCASTFSLAPIGALSLLPSSPCSIAHSAMPRLHLSPRCALLSPAWLPQAWPRPPVASPAETGSLRVVLLPGRWQAVHCNRSAMPLRQRAPIHTANITTSLGATRCSPHVTARPVRVRCPADPHALPTRANGEQPPATHADALLPLPCPA